MVGTSLGRWTEAAELWLFMLKTQDEVSKQGLRHSVT